MTMILRLSITFIDREIQQKIVLLARLNDSSIIVFPKEESERSTRNIGILTSIVGFSINFDRRGSLDGYYVTYMLVNI